jgi:hypothetical protein
VLQIILRVPPFCGVSPLGAGFEGAGVGAGVEGAGVGAGVEGAGFEGAGVGAGVEGAGVVSVVLPQAGNTNIASKIRPIIAIVQCLTFILSPPF